MTASEIKRIRSLREKKYRDAYGLFVAEGEKLVAEALRSGWTVEQVWRREEVGEKVMERISALSSPSPVLAVVRKPSGEEPPLPSSGLYLALDGIRDPGNLGTILRCADWFGVGAVYASPDTVDVFNPKVVQATMGAIFRVPVHYTDIASLCHRWPGPVYGTFLDGADIYAQTLETGAERPVMVITGSEADGISPAVAAAVTSRLYLPPYPPDDPGSESLNAAVATALTLAEFRRRALAVQNANH